MRAAALAVLAHLSRLAGAERLSHAEDLQPVGDWSAQGPTSQGGSSALLQAGDASSDPDDELGARPCWKKGVKGSWLFRDTVRYNCKRIWSQGDSRGGRCYFVGNETCVPNCLHLGNQRKDLCDGSWWCAWDWRQQRCRFNAANDDVRSEVCKRFGLVLNPQQKLLCSGMETGSGVDDGSWSSSGRRDPEGAILQGAARCWKPSLNRTTYRDPKVHSELKLALKYELTRLNAGGGPHELHPIATHNPLQMFGPLGEWMPHHFAVGLVNKRSATSLSYCLGFDYKNDRLADPAGCRFFRRSFEPLQAAVHCVWRRLEQDPYGVLWEKIAEWGTKQRPTSSWSLDLEAEALSMWAHEDHLGAVDSQFKETSVLETSLAAWRDCAGGWFCTHLGAYHRAVEFLKAVELQTWDGIGLEKARKRVRMALLDTKTIPQENHYSTFGSKVRIPRLLESTADKVATECFHLPAEADGHTGSEPVMRPHSRPENYEEALMHHKLLPERPMLLKESLRCLPLMWDLVEVPAMPKRAPWPTDWLPPQEVAFQVHPLCGRLALGGLVRQFGRSRYPQGLKLLQLTAREHVSRKYCMKPVEAQCKNFRQCWGKLMERFVPKIEAGCELGAAGNGSDSQEEEEEDEEAEKEEQEDHLLNAGSLACCCRRTQGISAEDEDGDCDRVKHQDRGVFGLRFFNHTSKTCCKLVQSRSGCMWHTRYMKGDMARCGLSW